MDWREARETTLSTLFTHKRLGLVTDMDGTISPIVNVPAEARPTARARDLLAALNAKLALVAIVSGRSAEDVQARVGLPQLVYVGNHGLERWRDGVVEIAPEAAPYRPQVEAAVRAAEAQTLEGLFVEDKGATLSVHYRNTADPAAAAEQLGPVFERIAAENGLRVFRGRMIFELRPPVAFNKGTAFRELVHEYALDAALYIGDDTTDADALRMAHQLRAEGGCYALGVGVDSDDAPDLVRDSADVLADGVDGVEDFFDWLLGSASASVT
jgi:trehalose 6-phosphate phosphatase